MIQIRDKLRPFSHIPGTQCVIPRSDYTVQVFPTLLKVCEGKEISLPLTGPVHDFTVQLDLEKGCLFIWGTAKEGYFRLRLEALEEGLMLTPLRGLKAHFGGAIILATGRKRTQSPMERLSLGCFKAQDWELIRRRADLKEIAPMLFLMGQIVPAKSSGFISDLSTCFLSSFSSLFFPHVSDTLYQGIAPIQVAQPLEIFPACYQAIRGFLIEETNILPALPSDWHAGRATNLQTSVGSIDLEWTKGMIRRMVFRSLKDEPVEFTFPKHIRSFRTTRQGSSILFDRFQK